MIYMYIHIYGVYKVKIHSAVSDSLVTLSCFAVIISNSKWCRRMVKTLAFGVAHWRTEFPLPSCKTLDMLVQMRRADGMACVFGEFSKYGPLLLFITRTVMYYLCAQ